MKLISAVTRTQQYDDYRSRGHFSVAVVVDIVVVGRRRRRPVRRSDVVCQRRRRALSSATRRRRLWRSKRRKWFGNDARIRESAFRASFPPPHPFPRRAPPALDHRESGRWSEKIDFLFHIFGGETISSVYPKKRAVADAGIFATPFFDDVIYPLYYGRVPRGIIESFLRRASITVDATVCMSVTDTWKRNFLPLRLKSRWFSIYSRDTLSIEIVCALY